MPQNPLPPPSFSEASCEHVPHPKLAREHYRGHLQKALAAKLAGNALGPARVCLVGDNLVDSDTGEVLDAAPGENPGLFLSAMHALAADPRFRWVGYRSGSDNRGEENSVPLSGSCWAVSDRADPSYQARLKTRGRRQILQALDLGWTRLREAKLPEPWAYRERFVTLTAPPQHPTPRLEEWALHNLALELLRDTAFFKARVWGGVKNLEDPGVDHPQVHSHSIWIARYVPQVALAWEWTRCHLDARAKRSGQRPADPRQAWLDEGWNLEKVLELEDRTSEAKKQLRLAGSWEDLLHWQETLEEATGTLKALRQDCFVVDVRLVGRNTSSTVIERQEAILEVCKYVTKTTDLLERSREDLLELLLPSRAPRVFDAFGACRKSWKPKDNVIPEAAGEGTRTRHKASLDTAAIIPDADTGTDPQNFHGESAPSGSNLPLKQKRPPSWRALMRELSLADFIAAMRARAASSASFTMGRLKVSGILAWTLPEVEGPEE